LKEVGKPVILYLQTKAFYKFRLPEKMTGKDFEHMILSNFIQKRMAIFTFLLGKVVMIFTSAVLINACVNDIEKIKAFSHSEILPVVQAENFETIYSDSGVVRFFLKTPELKRFESDDQPFVEFPKGVLLIKYNQNKEVISSISARYAKQFVKERRWEAKNDVVAINSFGDTLKTEHLIWDEQSGKIYNNEYVKVIRPDQVITGIGFEADQTLGNWRVRNPKGPIFIQMNRQKASPSDSVFGNLPVLRPVNLKNP
jgi:LPS export ABC transporter protein LptC